MMLLHQQAEVSKVKKDHVLFDRGILKHFCGKTRCPIQRFLGWELLVSLPQFKSF